MQTLKDSFGRTFPYIRLSITDVCNFKCGYCLPNGYQIDKSDNRKFLNLDEVKRLAKALSELGVSKIRLTGGEPTVRKDFFDIVKTIKENSGIKKTVITTNGYHLDKIAHKINDSGFLITFSYGRGLQASALKEFGKNQENIANIQKAFNHRAKMNGLSSKGEWSEDLEKGSTA